MRGSSLRSPRGGTDLQTFRMLLLVILSDGISLIYWYIVGFKKSIPSTFFDVVNYSIYCVRFQGLIRTDVRRRYYECFCKGYFHICDYDIPNDNVHYVHTVIF